jgi:hypothetical protein
VGKTTRDSPTFDLGAWLGSGSRRCWGSAAWSGGGRRELCSGEGCGTAAQLATRVARVGASGGSGTLGAVEAAEGGVPQWQRTRWISGRARHGVRRARAKGARRP